MEKVIVCINGKPAFFYEEQFVFAESDRRRKASAVIYFRKEAERLIKLTIKYRKENFKETDLKGVYTMIPVITG